MTSSQLFISEKVRPHIWICCNSRKEIRRPHQSTIRNPYIPSVYQRVIFSLLITIERLIILSGFLNQEVCAILFPFNSLPIMWSGHRRFPLESIFLRMELISIKRHERTVYGFTFGCTNIPSSTFCVGNTQHIHNFWIIWVSVEGFYGDTVVMVEVAYTFILNSNPTSGHSCHCKICSELQHMSESYFYLCWNHPSHYPE